jgi:hypothetical protein
MTSFPTKQIRIRLSKSVADKFLTLPPRLRSKVVSLLISSSNLGLDLNELLGMRRELVSLGTLINQSLKTSWGQTVDATAMRSLNQKLGRLFL